MMTESPISINDGVLSIRVATPGGGNVLDGAAMSEGAAALTDSVDSVDRKSVV